MKNQQPILTTEQIWRKLSDRLRQFIRSRVTSAPDVDDILQTVFLRIHQKLSDLQRVDRLEAWVFQITRNAVTDHFRSKRMTQIDVSALPETISIERPDNVNAEIAGCVAALIEQLPEDQRRAVAMYEIEGLSQSEIADRESISLSGTKSRIQRGRTKLEAMLRDCCQFQFDTRGNILQCESSTNQTCWEDECGK